MSNNITHAHVSVCVCAHCGRFTFHITHCTNIGSGWLVTVLLVVTCRRQHKRNLYSEMMSDDVMTNVVMSLDWPVPALSGGRSRPSLDPSAQ